jgi:peptidoglycan hydrolase-like protein with peptidoglycan-binding domain
LAFVLVRCGRLWRHPDAQSTVVSVWAGEEDMSNILSIIQLVVGLAPAIKGIYDAATSNTGVVDEIKKLSAPLATLLQQVGQEFFPKADPTIAIVGGLIAAFDPNTTKWLQGSINTLLRLSPPLAVDGQYGPLTKVAVEQMQTKLGLTVDGLAGKLTQAAIDAAIAKLPVIK